MLPPPQLSIHPAANGWIVILHPPERLTFSRVVRMALESISRAPTMMAALQAFHASLRDANGIEDTGLAVDPTGVGVTAGSPAEAADRVTRSMMDTMRPIETAEAEARASEPKCFICQSPAELISLITAFYLGDFGPDADESDEDDEEGDEDGSDEGSDR